MAFFKRKNSTTILTAPISGTSIFDAATAQRIFAIGERLLDHSRARKQGWLSSAFWSDKLMDWAMQDEGFKIQLFRFVDTFPTLVTPEQVHEHLLDYPTPPKVTLPPGLRPQLEVGLRPA